MVVRAGYLAAAVLLASGLPLKAATLVNFTLSLNKQVGAEAIYTNFHASGAGTGSEFAIGFQIQIQSVDGVAVSLSPIATFCSEIQELVSVASYTFEVRQLSELAAGQAGIAALASAAIPVEGLAVCGRRGSPIFSTGITFPTT